MLCEDSAWYVSQYLLHGGVKLHKEPIKDVGHNHNLNHIVIVIDWQELLPQCHVQIEHRFRLVDYLTLK